MPLINANPKASMDAILAPYGLHSDLIAEWNLTYGLIVAGSAAVAGAIGGFKPNNVDLWVYTEPSTAESARLRFHLQQRGFTNYTANDAATHIGKLLAEKLHLMETYSREDNDCKVNLYYTNCPLSEVLGVFDIRICSLYFDGTELKSFHWSPAYDIEKKYITGQHCHYNQQRIAKYMNRGFTVNPVTIIGILARYEELAKAEAKLQERNSALVTLYSAAETACKERDATIEDQKKYIASLNNVNTDTYVAIENAAKIRLKIKDDEIAKLQAQLFALAKLQ